MRRFLTFLLIAAVAATACYDTAFAVRKKSKKKPNIEQVRKNRDSANRNKQQTAKDIKAKDKELSRQINELERIEANISKFQDRVIKLNDEIDIIDAKIKIINDSVSLLENRISAMKAKYAGVVKKFYLRNRNATSDLAFIFSAESFSQAYRRTEALKSISKWQRAKAEELRKAKAALDKKKAELQSLKDSRSEMLQDLEAELQKLEAEREKCAKVVASLRKDQKRLKQLLEQRQAEEDKLNNELHRLIKEKEEEERREAERIREKVRQDSIAAAKKAEEEAKAREQEQQKKKNQDKKKDNSKKNEKKDKDKENKQSPKPKPQPPVEKKKPIETKPAPDFSKSGFSTLKGRLPHPVSGDIVRHFGKSQDIVTKIFRMNYGVGFCTRAGEPVSAVCDGKVTVVMRGSGFVIINHGVYNTVYRGLNGIKVAEGDSVKMGQTIGKVRTDPDDPEHCILSFEIIQNSTNIDPEPWFQ